MQRNPRPDTAILTKSINKQDEKVRHSDNVSHSRSVSTGNIYGTILIDDDIEEAVIMKASNKR